VLLRQRRLDTGLLADQPVERLVDLALGDIGEAGSARLDVAVSGLSAR
jgi:hypothetical protein